MVRRTPALLRSLDILELFLDGRDSVNAPDVVAELGLPRSSVHELLHTLADRGYLRADPDVPGRYRLGVQLFRLGSAYAERLDVATVGGQVAREVMASCSETVHLAVREGRDVVYVAKVDSPRAVRMVSALGGRVPAHCTAVGKVLLASMSEAELRELYGGDALPALTPASRTRLPDLVADLGRVREAGVATDECESSPEVCCVAAPVVDRTARTVAALSVSVPLHRWTEESRGELERLVVAGAARVSTALGGRPRHA